MRILATGIILSVLFASLPVEVWACGLNLCPMKANAKNQVKEGSMPCHGSTIVSEQNSADSDNIPVHIEMSKSKIFCPCTVQSVDFVFLSETSNHLKLIKGIHRPSKAIDGLKQIKQNNLFMLKRPPPIHGAARIQVILQTFLI